MTIKLRATFKVGDKVKVFNNKGWLTNYGTIVKVHDNGDMAPGWSYDVEYYDGRTFYHEEFEYLDKPFACLTRDDI